MTIDSKFEVLLLSLIEKHDSVLTSLHLCVF